MALARLALGLAVALGLCELLGLEGVARGTVAIACCMPGAVFNYLAALRYGRAPDEVAGYIVLSSLAVLLLLPALVPLAWWLAG